MKLEEELGVQTQERLDINVGGWYKEKTSGGLFMVLGVAKHSITWEWFVVYVHQSHQYLVAVPIKIWNETMESMDMEETK